MPQLSRDFDERKALIRGLINALIRNESIETTEPKANAIKGLVDKLVTKAKKNDLHNRRLINSFLDDEENTDKLIKTLAPALKVRSGGYVRVIKLGRRKGDNAMIVRVEFSDKPSKAKGKRGAEAIKKIKKEKPAKIAIRPGSRVTSKKKVN